MVTTAAGPVRHARQRVISIPSRDVSFFYVLFDSLRKAHSCALACVSNQEDAENRDSDRETQRQMGLLQA